jgi:photosystem II stability/assembly factor-like uncharacterized protein
MKRLLLVIISVILFLGCKAKYTPRNIDAISIQEFKMDSTSIRSMHVIDENTIYFAGSIGDIGYTKDGGKSWHKQTVRYQDSIIPHFRSLTSNGKDFFALSIGNPALLYRISEDKTDLVYAEMHEKVFYDSMKFFAEGSTGIAVGDPTEACASILMTFDSGNTWNKIPCSKLPEFADGEAFFAASNTNIKILDTTVWMASGGTKARVLKSDDFGKTWQIYDTPIVQGNGPQGIYSIDFYDKNNLEPATLNLKP